SDFGGWYGPSYRMSVSHVFTLPQARTHDKSITMDDLEIKRCRTESRRPFSHRSAFLPMGRTGTLTL
ncbi:hypothetical protein, partial [Nitrospira sp. BLG_2]|uniref:hypothetical protein n=1 Tax=Nitrospira sp. BLG_2 TaxID=3397507 RepID=UPI003BA32827